ncbi:MAG: hypothetical protein HOP12_00635 [Candidatus Eisenbacteria bacterium]|uniref:Capsule assembly Wzi family protein n=1 Tax=Eiseniibacteriota bacterium TaxID=2212470 RepID=A0A849SAG0_UNCEI|nr:hypothetical protein [Candidatus Eisenbacteria bacterium]
MSWLGRCVPITLACLGFVAVAPAFATPNDELAVGDPLESELRWLEVEGGARGVRTLRLPHLGTRPVTLGELAPRGRTSDSIAATDARYSAPSASLAERRVARWLARDYPVLAALGGRRTTHRFVQAASTDDEYFDASLGVEGSGLVARNRAPRLTSGSGAHLRFSAGLDGWLMHSHLVVGRFDGARRFADPIIKGSDATTLTEESALLYSGRGGRWGIRFGRGRVHWGPGDEASLLLSKTSAPFTALIMRGSFKHWGLHAVALSATLDASAGEQLAAHRLEWEPHPGVRFGLSEAARYQSESWQPIYLSGAVPYVLAQRLLVQDEPDSSQSLRNNVLFGLDAAWRVAPGTRVYGELLLDDVNASGAGNPDKIGWQLGWEGVGEVRGQRVTWNTEFTRVSRFVYTSFFGRSFEAQQAPLGFPSGPESRRLRARVGWDPHPDWQLGVIASRTDAGESDLQVAFVPGSRRPSPWEFAGVVERTRSIEAMLRYWPASGFDLQLFAGIERIDGAEHVEGARANQGFAGLTVRLLR